MLLARRRCRSRRLGSRGRRGRRGPAWACLHCWLAALLCAARRACALAVRGAGASAPSWAGCSSRWTNGRRATPTSALCGIRRWASPCALPLCPGSFNLAPALQGVLHRVVPVLAARPPGQPARNAASVRPSAACRLRAAPRRCAATRTRAAAAVRGVATTAAGRAAARGCPWPAPRRGGRRALPC